MIGARNVKGGLILISFGFLAGLLMSLYAFVPVVSVPAWLLEYDDLSRRLLRLAHIAAIMLPLLNVVLGRWLDRLDMAEGAKQLASWLLLGGAASVPLALTVEAVWPPARGIHLAGTPVIGFCIGVFLVSLGACRTGRRSFVEEATAGAAAPQRSPGGRHAKDVAA